MRARNLKPGFFQNECLAELPIAGRLLFAGLWCMADREGRLEDRPRRIKMQIFPADALDIDPLLQGLSDERMIVRYQVEGNSYIWIPSFSKHQKPHPKETASVIPPFEGDIQVSPRLNLDQTQELASPASSLNPSSLNPLKSSSEPAALSPAIVLKDGTEYHSPADLIAQWAVAYPNVVVAEELLKIAAWNRSNPGKRKTLRGITKHVNEWLSRANKDAAKAVAEKRDALAGATPIKWKNQV